MPFIHPDHFITVVGLCFACSAGATLLIAVPIMFWWRNGKRIRGHMKHEYKIPGTRIRSIKNVLWLPPVSACSCFSS